MYSRWYEVTVVLLWLAAMSWLVTQKVLPALLVGEPPDTLAIIEAQEDDPPVCWSMQFNGRELGWALNTTLPRLGGAWEVRSRVHFNELPLEEMLPGWMETVLGSFDRLKADFQMESRSKLVFDSAGKLSSFESAVQFTPGENAIEVRGAIEGSLISLNVHAGSLKYETELSLPPKALLGDALSPQTRLPGLHKGQTWTVKLYSPLRPPGSPMEILQAEVEGVRPINWNGHPEETWLVTYRSDPGSVFSDADKPREQLWVHPDGTVLKQQVTILDSTMTFVRLSPSDAAELVEALAEKDLSESPTRLK